jgi:hypothetical protein
LKDLGVDGKIILKYVKGKQGKFAVVLAGSEQGQELCCREDGYEILILIKRCKSLDYLKMCWLLWKNSDPWSWFWNLNLYLFHTDTDVAIPGSVQ